jgi:integrase
VTTKTKTRHPGITKITTASGETKYRLIIVVGKVPGTKPIKYIQECHTFRTMGEALKKQAEIRDARKRGALVKRENVTFDELCKRWLNSRHDVREVSREGYEHHLKAVRDQLGQEKVQDLSRADIENVIKSLRDRKSHSTIGHTLGAVSQVLDYGISSGLLSINVAVFVKAPRKQSSKALVDTKPRDEPWTQEELLRFRAVADQHEWVAAWRLTLCGLRRSEIMGMMWDSVGLGQGEIKVERGRVLLDGHRTAIDEPKSKASKRTVPVEDIQPGTTALHRSLRARQAQDRLVLGAGYPDTGLVLVNAMGEPVRPELYSDTFRKLCRQAGVRTIHLHLVRHTLANALNRAGVPIVDAAALLGHTPETYMRAYLRPTELGARSAASALGAALAGGS